MEVIFVKIWPEARNNSTAYKPKSLNENHCPKYALPQGVALG